MSYGLTREQGVMAYQYRMSGAGGNVPPRPFTGANVTGADGALDSADLLSLIGAQGAMRLSPAEVSRVPVEVRSSKMSLGALLNQAKMLFSTGASLNYFDRLRFETVMVTLPRAEALTPAHAVARVREAFGLSMRDAADVFRVSRPTLYAWSSSEDLSAIRAETDRRRLLVLSGLAREWSQRPPLLGRWLTLPLSDGRSVLDHLRAEDIDQDRLRACFTEISGMQSALRDQEQARTRAGVQGLRKAFARLDAAQAAQRDKP